MLHCEEMMLASVERSWIKSNPCIMLMYISIIVGSLRCKLGESGAWEKIAGGSDIIFTIMNP